MPRFNVGQRVTLDMKAIKSIFSDPLTNTYTEVFGVNTPIEVLHVNDDGSLVTLLSTHRMAKGESRGESTYGGIRASLFKPMGPPETVREMSYRVLAEAGYATV